MNNQPSEGGELVSKRNRQISQQIRETVDSMDPEDVLRYLRESGRLNFIQAQYMPFNHRPTVIDLTKEIGNEQKDIVAEKHTSDAPWVLFDLNLHAAFYGKNNFSVEAGYRLYCRTVLQSFLHPYTGEPYPKKAQVPMKLRSAFLGLIAFSQTRSQPSCSLVAHPPNIIKFIHAFMFELKLADFGGKETAVNNYLAVHPPSMLFEFQRSAIFLKKDADDNNFDGKKLAMFGISQNLVNKYKELSISGIETEKQMMRLIYDMFSTASYSFDEIAEALESGDL